MGASCDGARSSHGFQEFFLVLPGVFPRQLDLDVYRLAVSDTVSENVAFAMLTDMNDGTVFRVELTDRVVSCYTAISAQGGDNFVLQFSFGIYFRFLPLITCVAQ